MKKPLKPAIEYTFQGADINKLLPLYGLKESIFDLASKTCYVHGEDVSGIYWDLTIEDDVYLPPLREILMSSNPLEKIAGFDAMPDPYVSEDGEECASFDDLIALHAQGIYGLVEFWVSKLMLDGHVEKTDEYLIWLR